jgi:hypothetical protein
MDSSVSPKDEIWFLRVCHHISTGLYTREERSRNPVNTRLGRCHNRKKKPLAPAGTFNSHNEASTNELKSKTTSNLPQSNSRAQAAAGNWAEFKLNIISNIWLCSRQHTGRDGTSSLINKVHAQLLTDFKICTSKRYGCPVYTKRAAVYPEFTTADKFWSMCLVLQNV